MDVAGTEEWFATVGAELRDHQARDLESEERWETMTLIFEWVERTATVGVVSRTAIVGDETKEENGLATVEESWTMTTNGHFQRRLRTISLLDLGICRQETE